MKSLYVLSALLAALAMVGCRKGESQEGHDHDDPMQITAYTDTYELYAEATPMAAGEESEILAHFSHIPGFRPLAEGSVTATLTVGGKSVSQTLDGPDHPGIYEFTFTPPAAGNATLAFTISTGNSEDEIIAKGLTVYADGHEAEHAAAEAAVKSSNAVKFTKEMSWKVNFTTEEAQKRPTGQVIRAMGRIQPSQGDVRTVTARSGGVVAYASSDLAEGKPVGAGQALFRIDGSGMADDNLGVRVAEARNNYEAARREYERKEQLAKEKLVTAPEVTRARQEYDNARAVYENLSKGFGNGASTAISPIAGYITRLDVSNGEYVQPGQPLATVAQNRDLLVTAEVQPQYYSWLGDISGANFRRTNSDKTYTMAELGGQLVSYGKSASADNGMIPVVFRIGNREGFVPGTFVEMYLTSGSGGETIAVPSRALIEEMGNKFVYVQLTPEYFEKREVSTGRTDGLYTEITQGVNEGERVVADGAVLVKLAHSSGTLDAHSGHVH